MKRFCLQAVFYVMLLAAGSSVRGGYGINWSPSPSSVSALTDYRIYATVTFSDGPNVSYNYAFYRSQAGQNSPIGGGGGYIGSGGGGNMHSYTSPTVFNDSGGQIITYRIEGTASNMDPNDPFIDYHEVDIQGPISYALTINFGGIPGGGPGAFGAIDGVYPAGSTVSIAANPDPNGRPFANWSHISGPGTITNTSQASTTFVTGAGDATIQANYHPLYTLEVQNGTGDGSYLHGTVVTIAADTPPQGQVFAGWQVSGPGSLANASAAQTTFTMAAGNAVVNATYGAAPPPPTITQQPPDRNVVTGQSFSVFVFVSGGTPRYFQWWKDGSPIPGATSANYYVGAAELSHAGTYTVVVSNSYGSVTSAPATVTVSTPENLAWGTITPGVDPGTPVASAGVGALTANVIVDNKGAANGSIPLTIPPGRSGLQPSLSLNYNSAGGNGPLGIGWNLSTGFPQAITRGRSILARDSETRGVTFTSADKFYLDGKRLILTGGEVYGAHGTTYRTEVDSFVTVVGSDTDGDSVIDTFVVTDKSGVKMTFGKHPSSTGGYQMGGGAGETLAYAYALAQVEDTLGNTITFNYSEVINTAGTRFGEYVLSEIVYGGGLGRVTFHYNFRSVAGDTERLDRTTSYIAGKLFAQSRRLDGINVEFGETRTAYYSLAYDYAPDRGPLRLRDVTPYLHDGTGTGFSSFGATHLDWSDNTRSYTDQVNNGFMPAGPFPQDVENWGSNWMTTEFYAFGDVNGDGLDDLVDTRGTQIMVSLADGAGSFAVAEEWTASDLWDGPAVLMRLADVNGDGRKDVVFGRTFSAGGKLYALVSNGIAFVPLSGSGSTPTEIYTFSDEFVDSTPNTDYLILKEDQNGVSSRFAVADFTGDGCDDILIHRYDGWLKLIRWNGSSFTTNLPPYNVGAEPLLNENPWMVNPWTPQTPLVWLGLRYVMKFSIQMIPCELNGDGIMDYAWVHTEHKWDATEGTASTPPSVAAYIGKKGYAVTSLPSGGFSEKASLHSSGGMATSHATNYYRNGLGHLLVGDVNGDGLTDFLNIVAGDLVNNQRVMMHLLRLSRGGAGQPSFQYYEGAGITPTVSLSGLNGAPYFDSLSSATWSNNYFDQIGNMPSSLTGMFMSFNLSSSGENMYLHDVNQDGRQDYLWYVDAPATRVGWWVMYSLGTSFDAPVPVPAAQIPWTPTEKYTGGYDSRNLSTRQALQLNGDGIPDYAASIVSSTATPGVNSFHISNGQPGYRLETLTDGLGRKTEISYKPITDNSIYTPGAAVTYPIREMRNATYVVSDVWQDSGVDGQSAQFSYQYSGRRTDLSGRGDLGFHSFVTLDHQTDFFKYQFLTQSFPMTGLTAREQTYRYWIDSQEAQAKFRLISTHDNTVVFDKVVDAANTAFNTLYPFISMAVESRWEDSTTAAHFSTTPAASTSQPEYLFPKSRPADPHITITAKSLFDKQVDDQTYAGAPQLTVPSGFGASDRNASGENVVGGTPTLTHLIDVLSELPGKITDGNLRKLETDFGDGLSETILTKYKTGVALKGLVDWVTTTVTSPEFGTEEAPKKSYTYFGNSPLIASETIDADDTDLDLTTTYTRGTRGRVEEITVSGSKLLGENSISSFITYKATAFDDRFDLPTREENAFGHPKWTSYHPFLGQPVSVTDVNGAEVTTTYDALGRVTQVYDVMRNQQTNTAYVWDASHTVAPPAGVEGGLTLTSKYRVDVTSPGNPSVSTYYDRLGRDIRAVKEGFGSIEARTDTVYNKLGQVVAASTPYQTGGTAYWTRSVYDDLGRVKTVTAPNNTKTTTTYEGRLTHVEVDAPDRGPQINTTLVDAKGRTVAVWNANNPAGAVSGVTGLGGNVPSIAFSLDGFGRMRKTTLKDQTLQPITATYDALGRQTSLHDPDKGPWSYENSPLGYVLKQTDARSNVTSTTYDKLGRPLTRTTTETAGPIETAKWFYYDVAESATWQQVPRGEKGWIGALQREEVSTTGAPGYAAFNATTTTGHYYDERGRPAVKLTNIDNTWFYTYTDYDTYSRVRNVRHFWRPAAHQSGATSPSAWEDFGYTYNYDAKGYLLSLKDTASPARTWWEAHSTLGYDYADRPVLVRKGSGHWTQRTYDPDDGVLTAIKTGPTVGSASIQNLGFTYDGLGNLTSRSSGSLSEIYGYDDLNRLTTRNDVTITTYYDNGNIKKKANVAGVMPSAEFNYDPTNKPHAVTAAWGYAMGYDASGNLISRETTGELWDFRYAGFDKPRWMAKITATGIAGSEFLYDANRSRTVHLEFDAMSGGVPSHYVRKRVYGLGATLEANYDNLATSGPANWSLKNVRIYVPGPEGVVGAREFDPTAAVGDQEEALVYHYDHLGSIDAITDFADTTVAFATDDSGNPGRFSEDAWGQRRNPFTWNGAPLTTGTNASDNGGADSLTPRGFTGHEMLDDLGLVHMNGRIYDPLLGRFLSADIVVQAPGSLQSYNRYSYVMNNPLTLTDPSGFFWDPNSGFWGGKEWGTFGSGVLSEYLGIGERVNAGAAEVGYIAADMAMMSADLRNTGEIDLNREVFSATFKDSNRPTIEFAGVDFDAGAVLTTTEMTATVGTLGGYNAVKGGVNMAQGNYAGAQDNFVTTVLVASSAVPSTRMNGQLAQDAGVNPNAPRALDTNRPVGGTPAQNRLAQADVQTLRDSGHVDLRVNQQQTNGAGARVGTNRPDVAGTTPGRVLGGDRVTIEYEQPGAPRGQDHVNRTLNNDPRASVTVKEVDPASGTVTRQSTHNTHSNTPVAQPSEEEKRRRAGGGR